MMKQVGIALKVKSVRGIGYKLEEVSQMKHNLKYLASYLPWLFVLLAFDLFTAVLLWLSDVRMFQALILLYI